MGEVLVKPYVKQILRLMNKWRSKATCAVSQMAFSKEYPNAKMGEMWSLIRAICRSERPKNLETLAIDSERSIRIYTFIAIYIYTHNLHAHAMPCGPDATTAEL
jgi:hypothetical protein